MKLLVKKLHPDAIVPKYATVGSACFDLHSIGKATIGVRDNSAVFHTGLSFEIPTSYVMLIFSRSGHGFKNGVRLANCVGVIDSDYRGEVCVKLHVDEMGAFDVSKGDRIAQAMLVAVPSVHIIEVAELSLTERGEGGFGSTGVA